MILSEIFELLGNPPQPLVEARLGAFEAETNLRLPDELRQIVVRSTGAELNASLQAEYASKLYDEGFGRLFVDRFLTLTDDPQDSLRPLSAYLAEFGADVDDISPQLICVAEDGFGNVVTIDLRPEHYGVTAFVDHELIGHPSHGDHMYQIVAPSFVQFVAMLDYADDDEDEVDA